MVKDKRQKTKPKSEEKASEGAELLKSQLVRALADYDNLRKRIESEKKVWEGIAASKVVIKLLPVLDMILEAQKHLQDAGLEIVIGEFRRSLYDLGVEEIRITNGDEFNPLEEEVIEMVAGGKENTVAEVLLTGWKIKGENFIIRPAKVKVYKASN